MTQNASALDNACSANLACARSNVVNAAKGVTDIKCTVGATCAHTIPLKHTFISSPSPEHFGLYDLILAYIREVNLPFKTICLSLLAALNPVQPFSEVSKGQAEFCASQTDFSQIPRIPRLPECSMTIYSNIGYTVYTDIESPQQSFGM